MKAISIEQRLKNIKDVNDIQVEIKRAENHLKKVRRAIKSETSKANHIAMIRTAERAERELRMNSSLIEDLLSKGKSASRLMNVTIRILCVKRGADYH